MQENPWLKSIPFLWLVGGLILALEVGARFDLPILNFKTQQETVTRDVLAEVDRKLPELVTTVIGDQIQELAMDRIELDQNVQSAVDRAVSSEPIVLRIGEQKVTRGQFMEGLKRMASEPDNAGKSREELKGPLVEQMHRHLAIVQDAQKKGLHRQPEFRQQVENLQSRTFIGLLFQDRMVQPTLNRQKQWYQENRDLFSQGDRFTFRYRSAASPESLQDFTSEQKWESASGVVTVTNAQESEIPYAYARALRSLSVGEVSPVLRVSNRFHVLQKTSVVQKSYLPYSEVKGVVKAEMMWKNTRDTLAKIANPLRFQYEVQSEPLIIEGRPMEEAVQSSLTKTLPPWFVKRLQQAPTEARPVIEDVGLILYKYSQNPVYFSEDLHTRVQSHTRALKEVLLTRKMQQSLLEQVPPPSKEELQQIYDTNPDRFVQARGDLARHIFIKNRSRALELLNRVLLDPSHFESMAKTLSEEPRTQPHGGDMRYLKASDITEEMHQTVEGLQNGEVHSSLVNGAEGGFHILKLVQKDAPLKVATFEQIEPRLKEAVTHRRQQQALQQYIQKVKNRYKLHQDNRLINTL